MSTTIVYLFGKLGQEAVSNSSPPNALDIEKTVGVISVEKLVQSLEGSVAGLSNASHPY
jgi:hypothetical protein